MLVDSTLRRLVRHSIDEERVQGHHYQAVSNHPAESSLKYFDM
jgi:hypothetical protein